MTIIAHRSEFQYINISYISPRIGCLLWVFWRKMSHNGPQYMFTWPGRLNKFNRMSPNQAFWCWENFHGVLLYGSSSISQHWFRSCLWHRAIIKNNDSLVNQQTYTSLDGFNSLVPARCEWNSRYWDVYFSIWCWKFMAEVSLMKLSSGPHWW